MGYVWVVTRDYETGEHGVLHAGPRNASKGTLKRMRDGKINAVCWVTRDVEGYPCHEGWYYAKNGDMSMLPLVLDDYCATHGAVSIHRKFVGKMQED